MRQKVHEALLLGLREFQHAFAMCIRVLFTPFDHARGTFVPIFHSAFGQNGKRRTVSSDKAKTVRLNGGIKDDWEPKRWEPGTYISTE